MGRPLYPNASVPSTVPGILRVPLGDGPFPAMVILHGSAGIDGRGEEMAKVLLDAGIAPIEPDMWKVFIENRDPLKQVALGMP